MAKLVEEKIVVESSSGEHRVDDEILRQSSFPKYLGIKRITQMACTERGDNELNQLKNIDKEEHKIINQEVNKDTGNKELKNNVKGEKISDSIKRGRVRKLRSESKPTSSKRAKHSKEKVSTVEDTDQLI